VRGVIKKVNHITFPVSDLESAIAFYEKVLGLKKTGESSNYAVFDVGGVEFGLELGGKQSIYLLVDDVDKQYQDLVSRNVEFLAKPEDQPWGGRAATFADPDGNMFSLVQFK
jgi:catechol 2,3-dioxygenase-like lactoylglutathione lyase family enzyme